MATSSKVQFKLDVLKQKALEAIDFRINQKKAEVESLGSDDALAQQVADWRTQQEQKLEDIVYLLKNEECDDLRLSRFALDPIPSVDRYERQRAERDLRSLQAKRAEITAKAESLVADADGCIALTKTQLAEFFGL